MPLVPVPVPTRKPFIAHNIIPSRLAASYCSLLIRIRFKIICWDEWHFRDLGSMHFASHENSHIAAFLRVRLRNVTVGNRMDKSYGVVRR